MSVHSEQSKSSSSLPAPSELVNKAKEEKLAEKSASGIKSFISGGAGGVAAVLVGQFLSLFSLDPPTLHLSLSLEPGRLTNCYVVSTGQPFDLTKVRLQTAKPGQYTGTLDVVKQTLARDGLKG